MKTREPETLRLAIASIIQAARQTDKSADDIAGEIEKLVVKELIHDLMPHLNP